MTEKKIKDENDKMIVEIRNNVIYEVVQGVLIAVMVLIIVYIVLGLKIPDV